MARKKHSAARFATWVIINPKVNLAFTVGIIFVLSPTFTLIVLQLSQDHAPCRSHLFLLRLLRFCCIAIVHRLPKLHFVATRRAKPFLVKHRLLRVRHPEHNFACRWTSRISSPILSEVPMKAPPTDLNSRCFRTGVGSVCVQE